MLASATYDAYGAPTTTRLRSSLPSEAITQLTSYDNRHRPHAVRVERGLDAGVGGAPGTLNAVQVPFAELYDWDRASNLVRITSQAGPDPFPAGRRQMRRTIAHDSLSRVAQVSMDYLQDDLTWGPTDAATDWREERQLSAPGGPTNLEVDPMRSEPSPHLGPKADARIFELMYEYDWLANMTVWEDDSRTFHERSIGEITNGADDTSGTGANPEYRPSALYVSSNIRTSAGQPLDPRAGWVDVDYGEGGNVEALTIHGECTDAPGQTCTDGPTLDIEARETQLRTQCTCASEQHFQYRWDELNRISEARRYDRDRVSREWALAARMRARYDSGNERLVKQSIDPTPATPEVTERIHLYAYPGDFERVGVTADHVGGVYRGSSDLGTETEFHVAGAKVVQKAADPSDAFHRNQRATMPIGDLLGSASAVVDLDSGELLEMATFHPNGGREMHWMNEVRRVSVDRRSFTAKEEDEEVGLAYFGHRYLAARIGRWTSVDPISTHESGGGEIVNGFHYVAGSILQARDPDGLDFVTDNIDVVRSRFGIPPENGCAAGFDGWCVGRSSGSGRRMQSTMRRFDSGADFTVRQIVQRMSDQSIRDHVDASIANVERISGRHLDRHLVLVIAGTEGMSAFSTGRSRYNSYDEGGLDNLGSTFRSLPIPEDVRDRIEPAGRGRNEVGGRTLPATLQRRDTMTVVAGSIARAEATLVGRIAEAWEVSSEEAQRLFAGMSADARRMLTQIAFGRENGRAYEGTNISHARGFGLRTVLGRLKALAGSNAAMGLEWVVSDDWLDQFHAVHSAKIRAANAALLDSNDPSSAPPPPTPAYTPATEARAAP